MRGAFTGPCRRKRKPRLQSHSLVMQIMQGRGSARDHSGVLSCLSVENICKVQGADAEAIVVVSFG